MDPLTNLREQRSLARKIIAMIDSVEAGTGTMDVILDCAEQLAENVIALDKWRITGGFDPYGATPASLTKLDRFNDMQHRALRAEARLARVEDILKEISIPDETEG